MKSAKLFHTQQHGYKRHGTSKCPTALRTWREWWAVRMTAIIGLCYCPLQNIVILPYYNDTAHTCTFLITKILHTRVHSLLQRYCTHGYIPYCKDTAHTCTFLITKILHKRVHSLLKRYCTHVYSLHKNMCIFYDAATSRDLFYIKLRSVVSDEVRNYLGGQVEWEIDGRTDGSTGRGEWTDSGTANRLYCILYSTVYGKIRGRLSIWHYASSVQSPCSHRFTSN